MSMASPSRNRISHAEPTTQVRPEQIAAYRLGILRNPLNLAPQLFGLMLFPIAGWTIVPLALCVQLMCWLVLPRLAWVRQSIDAVEVDRARQASAAARLALLSRIDEEHRDTFVQLESLLADVSRRACALDNRDVGLRWLLSHYLELAIAHKPMRDRMKSDGQSKLTAEIAMLEMDAQIAEPSLVQSIEQQTVIARRRLVLLDRSDAERVRVEANMLAIAALIELAHESIAAPLRIESIELDIGAAIAEFTEERCSSDALEASSDDVRIDDRVFDHLPASAEAAA